MFTKKQEGQSPNPTPSMSIRQKRAFDCWTWTSEISHKNCQKLIDLGEDRWDKARIGGATPKESIPNDDFRKSDVAFVNRQWVQDLIWDYMSSANEQAGWKYDIVASEDSQITRYNKDEFYAWHRDGLGSHIELLDTSRDVHKTSNLYGNARKLSMSVLLNDDYEGGNFQMHGQKKDDTLIQGEGSIIVFPSFIDHQVTPVTKGTRYSLVTWFVGPPFV